MTFAAQGGPLHRPPHRRGAFLAPSIPGLSCLRAALRRRRRPLETGLRRLWRQVRRANEGGPRRRARPPQTTVRPSAEGAEPGATPGIDCAKPSRVSLWAALIGGAAAILLVLLAAAGLAIRFWPRQPPPPTPVAVIGDSPTPPASTADASPPKDAVPPTDVQAPAPTKANAPPEPPAPTPPPKTPAPTPPEPPAPTPPPIKPPPGSPPAVTGSHWVVLTDVHQYWYDDEAHPPARSSRS